MSLPLNELKRRSRIRFRLLKSHDALIDHFARSIADEIKTRNHQNLPTRLILPVGPVVSQAGGYLQSRSNLVEKRIHLQYV